MRILGLDPGSQVTGYGVVEASGAGWRWLGHGSIRTSAEEGMAARLGRIHAALVEVVAAYAPDEVAVERVFVNRNVAAALKLGQARGAALVAVAAGGRPIHEFSATEVKLAIVGQGRADKRQVQLMVTRLLNLAAPPPEDAADALAVALCHAHQRRLRALVPGVRVGRGRVPA